MPSSKSSSRRIPSRIKDRKREETLMERINKKEEALD
jgi:hypothetical protein